MPIISGTKPEEKTFSLGEMLKDYRCFHEHHNDYIDICISKNKDGWWNRLWKRKDHFIIARIATKSYNNFTDVKEIRSYGYAATCYQIACELEKEFNISITLNLYSNEPQKVW